MDDEKPAAFVVPDEATLNAVLGIVILAGLGVTSDGFDGPTIEMQNKGISLAVGDPRQLFQTTLFLLIRLLEVVGYAAIGARPRGGQGCGHA